MEYLPQKQKSQLTTYVKSKSEQPLTPQPLTHQQLVSDSSCQLSFKQLNQLNSYKKVEETNKQTTPQTSTWTSFFTRFFY